jgi:hypothetical protein
MSAANDFTVLIAASFAFRPTLITASESEDMDFSEVVDGERPRFLLAMVNECGQVLSLFMQVKYVYFVYYIVFKTTISGCRSAGLQRDGRVCRVGAGSW